MYLFLMWKRGISLLKLLKTRECIVNQNFMSRYYEFIGYNVLARYDGGGGGAARRNPSWALAVGDDNAVCPAMNPRIYSAETISDASRTNETIYTPNITSYDYLPHAIPTYLLTSFNEKKLDISMETF